MIQQSSGIIWMPLTNLPDMPQSRRLSKLKFPDGNTNMRIDKAAGTGTLDIYREILKVIAEWLIKNNKFPNLPIMDVRGKQNLLDKTPAVKGRLYGNSMLLYNGWYLTVNFKHRQVAENAIHIVKLAGEDPEDFLLS